MSNLAEDRRNKQEPIPSNLDFLLNDKQKESIEELITIGWQLWFVRRPRFQPVTPVLVDRKYGTILMVDEDGSTHEESILMVRQD